MVTISSIKPAQDCGHFLCNCGEQYVITLSNGEKVYLWEDEILDLKVGDVFER